MGTSQQDCVLIGLLASCALSFACGGSLNSPSQPPLPLQPTPAPALLTVAPKTVTMGANEVKCFTASGGDGRYSWSLDFGRGILTPQGVQACFKSDIYYTQFRIIVSSGDGQQDTTTGVVFP